MEVIGMTSKTEYEIRTSLACVKGYIDLLRNEVGELDDTQATFLGVVDRSVDRLISAINKLMPDSDIVLGPQLVLQGGSIEGSFP